MHGVSIVDLIVAVLKFDGFRDVSFMEKIKWIITYPIVLLLFLFILAMFYGYLLYFLIRDKF